MCERMPRTFGGRTSGSVCAGPMKGGDVVQGKGGGGLRGLDSVFRVDVVVLWVSYYPSLPPLLPPPSLPLPPSLPPSLAKYLARTGLPSPISEIGPNEPSLPGHTWGQIV